jgi:N-acetylglucosamine-6-phosphate deacetylase
VVRLRLRSERIVTPGGVVAGEVTVAGGLVSAVRSAESVASPGSPGSGDGDVVDLGGRWLVPGFIDLHVHGGGGAQCNTFDADEITAVARFHTRHGTTSLLATLVPAGADELAGCLEATRVAMPGTATTTQPTATVPALDAPIAPAPHDRTAPARSGGAHILGAHLEGPFLSPRFAGALDPTTFIPPRPDVARRLLLSGGGCLAMMTVAPELPGALSLIGELVEAGVVVSLGHSDASYEQSRAAVQAGARSATHVFNAMAPLHHRAPGLLGAVLELPEVSCELICDGVHVDPVTMRLLYRLKGAAGVHLVTDAIAAAGMPDGAGYRLGRVAVEVVDGRATVAGTDALAGSMLTMDAAVAGAVGLLDVDVAEAVAMASANPARLLGLHDRKGAITPGLDADLVVLDDQLRACGTMVAGEWVYGPPG